MRVRKVLKRAAVTVAAMLVLLVVALFAAGVVWPERELAPIRTNTPIAIVGVSIIDPGGEVPPMAERKSQTVLVSNGRVVAVGDEGTVSLPPDAAIVDGRGPYLLPALWDMHTHVYAVSPLLDLPLYIAHGVTNVRDMQGCPQPNDPFIACSEDKRTWSAEAMEGRRVGPRIVSTTSFMANGPGVRKRLKSVPEFFETATPDQARAFVRHFAGRANAIKVYDRLPRDAYLALSDEARRLGLEVVGHRPHAVSAIEAAQHQKSIEHARFHPPRIVSRQRRAARSRRHAAMARGPAPHAGRARSGHGRRHLCGDESERHLVCADASDALGGCLCGRCARA